MIEKSIHDLAPSPKTIMARPTPFRKTRHSALKRMRMHIRNGGQQKLIAQIHVARLFVDLGLNRFDFSLFKGQPNIVCPTIGQKGVACE
jgi:hypothetical protein